MTIIPFSTAKTRDTACAVTALETLIERYKEHIGLSQDELLSTCPFGYQADISHLIHLCYVGIVEGFIYNLESRIVELVEDVLSVQHFESLVEFHRQCDELDNAPYITARRSFWLGDTITTITFVQIDSVSQIQHICIGTSNLWNWVVDILVDKVNPNPTEKEKDRIFYSPDFYTQYTNGNFGETPMSKITTLKKSKQRVYPLSDYLYSDVAVTKVGECGCIIFNEYQHELDDVISVRLKLGEFEEYMGKYDIIPTEAIAQIAMIRGWVGMCTKYPNGFLVKVKTLSFIDGKKYHVIRAGRTEEGKYQRSYFTTDGELFVDEMVKSIPRHNLALSRVDNIGVGVFDIQTPERSVSIIGDASTPTHKALSSDLEVIAQLKTQEALKGIVNETTKGKVDVEDTTVDSDSPTENLTTRTILSQLFKSVGDAFILAGQQLADKDQL